MKCFFSMDARVKPGHDESRTIAVGITRVKSRTHLAFYAGWPSALRAAQLACVAAIENQKLERG
jgi:hypothetical protein